MRCGWSEVLEDALTLAPAQRSLIAHELIERLEGDAGAERERKVEAIRAALQTASGVASLRTQVSKAFSPSFVRRAPDERWLAFAC